MRTRVCVGRWGERCVWGGGGRGTEGGVNLSLKEDVPDEISLRVAISLSRSVTRCSFSVCW